MKNKRKIIIILTVLIVAVISTLAIWYYSKINNTENQQKISEITWSRDEVKQDFENGKEKIVGDSIPPQNIKDRYDTAISKSKSAIESNKPSNSENKDLFWDYLTIATSYGILGDYKQAEEWYFNTLEKFPDDYRANMNLGDLYILMNRPSDAAVKFYDTIKLYPKDALIYTKFAELYYKYSSKNSGRADEIFDIGVANSDQPKIVLNSYIIYLQNFKKDLTKLEQIKREYEKLSDSKIEQQREQIQQSTDLK